MPWHGASQSAGGLISGHCLNYLLVKPASIAVPYYLKKVGALVDAGVAELSFMNGQSVFDNDSFCCRPENEARYRGGEMEGEEDK